MSKLPTSDQALQGLASAMVEEAKSGLVSYQPTDLDLLPWAEQNRNFKGRPFALDGHEYLRELYEQPFRDYRYCVLEKAAQMGASEYAMTAALWFCDRHPRTRTIFFLPSDQLVQDFSHDRITPILESSPRLSQIRGNVDNVGLKMLGHSALYLRGMFAKSKVKSIPADLLIFDELDEAKPANKQQAIERISHSDFRWVLELSTPTLPGYGIDLQWQNTDQRYWHLACRCPEGVVLEDTWPECVGERDGGYFLRCPKCGKENLHPCDFATLGEYRGWVPRYTGMEKRGYHLTQLFSMVIPLSEIMELWNSGRDREEFYNSKLGMPYAGDRMPLTLPVLRECAIEAYPLEAKREGSERIFLGADQGLELHIVATRLLPNKQRKTIWLERVAGADPFARLAELIKKLKPTCTVIDAMPNILEARRLAMEFKDVYVCHYSDTAKDKLSFNKDTKRVLAHRTDSLNEMVDDWLQKVFAVPSGNPEVEVAFSHLKSLAKVIETDPDTGIQREVFIHIGADHYGHAFCYEGMAARYPYGKSHFDML